MSDKPSTYELAARAGVRITFAEFSAMPEAEQVAAAEAGDDVFLARERIKAQFLAEALNGGAAIPTDEASKLDEVILKAAQNEVARPVASE